MKTFLLALFFCLLSGLAVAQSGGPAPTITIEGTVLDSANNKPMGYVTVAIQDSKTHTGIKSGLTKDNGTFALKAPAGKTYEAILVFVGYRNKTVAISGGSTDVNIGKVLLAASSSQLKEVSVTAARPLMKQEVDRISYDIQADPDSKALSVLDMMRKVPLLTVDGNDNIQLKGSSNYKILINGKESALVAKNPSDILKSMPATNIEKIEVITTPPAKYDAEGLAGIINIVTKRNADQGYNIGFNSRFNSVFGAGYNINGTVKQGKFGASFFGGFGSNGTLTNTNGNIENIFATNTNINQSGTTTQKGRFHYGGTELSYEIDTLNLLTASVDLFGNNQDQHGLSSSLIDSLGITKQAYTLHNTGNGSFTGFDASINYQLGFKKSKDELLTISYKYSYSPNKQYNDNVLTDRIQYNIQQNPDYRQYNDAGDRDHTIQIDYATPLSKVLSIEAGTKAILRSNYSDYHVDDRYNVNNPYMSNDTLTNNFTYHQDIYSVYNSYQLKMDKWTGKAGLRLEHTALSADFTSAGSSIAPSYNNLIPSVSIQRSFKSSSLNFGYTQRIQRPGIFQLNPFTDKSNPTFINTGNPALKPELDNTFELTYSNFTKNSINIGLSYAFSNNSIQNVSSLRTIPGSNGKLDTVTYTTFENLGANKTLGLNVHTNMNLTKRFTLGLNGQVNHVWLSGKFDGGEYHNDGFTGNAFGNLRYKFDNGFALSFNAGFFSGNVNLQGSSSNFIFNQYLVSKEFFKRKLTLVLVANNPYSKYNTFRNTVHSNDFYQSSYNQNYYRSFAFRVNFKFGKFNGNIKKNEHGIENDDTKGGNKSSSGNGN
ncbi:outer membrane beta-barrel protein [Mucilaginibacter sp. BT774]|uniref:outer membrane beta-barrel protein n=1 Tax=Mucilaginibacter sp. BT774 TaxID=3062276 RepID=UPI002674BB94|nr:outer membrane beta-barrel protein [Mucilaginibacter sp. BT774]MDO3629135.1 TonB-dependent receptor [Mucilaginibacter sp. BT774]